MLDNVAWMPKACGYHLVGLHTNTLYIYIYTIHVCVCMYVCTYVRMYVCMYGNVM